MKKDKNKNKCPECNGDGVLYDHRKHFDKTCFMCGGTGKVKQNKILKKVENYAVGS